jgi:hypothetical protein
LAWRARASAGKESPRHLEPIAEAPSKIARRARHPRECL